MNIVHGNPGAIPEHTPDIRSACPDCKRISAFLRAYLEFGYTTLTWEECRVSYEEERTSAWTAVSIVGRVSRAVFCSNLCQQRAKAIRQRQRAKVA